MTHKKKPTRHPLHPNQLVSLACFDHPVSEAGGCLDGKQHLGMSDKLGADGVKRMLDTAGIKGSGSSSSKQSKSKKRKGEDGNPTEESTRQAHV